MMYQLILVEDDDQIRNGLSRFFPWEQLGFLLSGCFENGLQALNYVRGHTVDVILTDVRMPVMDGWTCWRRCGWKTWTLTWSS
jgi:YesN/AraC family two-component response regulator